MQTEIRRQSPLAGVQDLLAQGPSDLFQQFRIEEQAFLELNNIRGNSGSPPFMRAVAEVLGIELPIQANTVAAGEHHVLWWLGPDEWLVQSVLACEPMLEASLRARFGEQFASSVDVSSGYTVLHLSGVRAREVLQKGCPLDLHPAAFEPGHCAQSHFFKATIALRVLPDDAWMLVVRRSFADYVVRMLLDAAHEFSL